ncbi:uncharacterized protein LOC128674990 isoform X5 [Plodia interpunctella]|uniref:uncharacterized protein LOC128674990 isoform X5 n=1 Tax=Plodia interpunctella TaxID=58824 RepID=UPI002367859C|nr:uncharacterized protein LOC128674990 isoform X5 [Plodia interpunctella]
MSVELLNLLRNEAKITRNAKTQGGGNHWFRRKEAFRAKRGVISSAPGKQRPRRQIDGSGVVVRAEEALIVAFVLLLWIAAIALFFNRWGKIRMLEPYQPKFQQQHRQSCALAEASVSVPPHHRASLSRGCVSYDCGGAFPPYQPCGYLAHRPRQNSVFVGSMGGMALIPESPPRRSRSAADLPALVPPADHSRPVTPRSSRAASLHSAVDLRVYVPSPRTSRAASLHSAVDMPSGSVQVHARGSGSNLNRPRSPRRLTITNV